MTRQEKIQIIEREKMIAIVRSNDQKKASFVLQNLIKGGVKVLEVTANTPGYVDEIRKIRQSSPEVLIGAGTVINIKTALKAIEAGAQFLVTPNVNEQVIQMAHEHNIPVAMGALTPTEICMAVESGADIIKLFPAGTMGIDYFKAVRAPLSKVKFFIVGGVNLDNVEDWMMAGAAGIGVGSVLTDINGDDTASTVRNKVKQFISILEKY